MNFSPPSKASSPARQPWISDVWAIALTMIWLVSIRTLLGVPWGWETLPGEGDLLPGIAFNAGDTWFYLSLVVQYAEGYNGAELIYTTEAHPGLLWIFPLWLMGITTALTGCPPLFVYNVSGVVGAMAAVFAFRRVTRLIVSSASACDWATAIMIIGSGGSWVWHLVHGWSGLPALTGGEFAFLDFLPATTFLAYPYHAISGALLASLWWSVTVFEQRSLAGQSVKLQIGLIAGCAMILTFSRPYEPLAFSAAYGIKMALAWSRRRTDPAVWTSCRNTTAILAFGLAPGVAWTAFVSTQPIWSGFAQRALALGLPRSEWLTGFGFLWLAAAVAAPRLYRLPHLRGLLPLCATLLSAGFLLGFGNSGVKLSSGLPLGVTIAAGVGLALVIETINRHVTQQTGRVVFGLAAAVLVLGTPSLHLNLLAIRLSATKPVEAELSALMQWIPPQTGDRRTTVLTDTNTGLILPGWLGLRVFAGHWGLTHNFKTKEAQIRAAGLDPERQSPTTGNLRENLTQLLQEADVDYVIIDTRCEQALTILPSLHWDVWKANTRWVALRPTRE